jgi:LAO/AO transport system kinase
VAKATRETMLVMEAAGYDVVLVETVGVGQSETDVAELCDSVAVVVQPGSGDTLQFLKAGIMEVPDVLVVTKADLGQPALRAQRDLATALRALGKRDTPVVAVSSVPPPSGIEELVAALDAHRDALDLPARRARSRRLAALAELVAERGESALRKLGGGREAMRFLGGQDPALGVRELVELLERRAAR